MSTLEMVAGLWFAVLDASAQAAAALASRVSARRRLNVLAAGTGELLVYPAGQTARRALGRIALAEPGVSAAPSRLLRRSHVTVDYDPDRFVFRTVLLPAQATEFVEAIVRTQIDRLTPWRPEQVAFGWTPPLPDPVAGGITLTVAAAHQDTILPVLARIQALGAAVVVGRVTVPEGLPASEGDPGRTIMIVQGSAAPFAVAFWRRALGLATAAVVALVIGATLYDQIASFQLDAMADEVAQASAAKRALLTRSLDANDPAAAARRVVDERKAEAPFATLVLETVSRTLPDDTFLTSLEITGNRVRLIGFAKDAPALIRLIDASGRLTGATFFAPTTRLPEEPGDRFNIEATVLPGAEGH